MPMNWWTRVGIGIGLGAAAALGLAFFLDGWILPAAVGATLGLVGFLGSFFLFNPDQPPTPENPEGYEQVLFDARNSVASVALAVMLVALAFTVRFDAADDDGGLAAYLEARDRMLIDLEDFQIVYASQAGEYEAGVLAKPDYQAQLQAQAAEFTVIVDEALALEAPAAYEADVEALQLALAQLLAAFQAQDLCLSDIQARCAIAAEKFEASRAGLDKLAPPLDADADAAADADPSAA